MSTSRLLTPDKAEVEDSTSPQTSQPQTSQPNSNSDYATPPESDTDSDDDHGFKKPPGTSFIEDPNVFGYGQVVKVEPDREFCIAYIRQGLSGKEKEDAIDQMANHIITVRDDAIKFFKQRIKIEIGELSEKYNLTNPKTGDPVTTYGGFRKLWHAYNNRRMPIDVAEKIFQVSTYCVFCLYFQLSDFIPFVSIGAIRCL